MARLRPPSVLRRRPLLAALVAALVAVPVAGAAVIAGGGDDGRGAGGAGSGDRGGASQRAATADGDDIDRLIAQRRARPKVVEPDAGLPAGVVVETGPTDFPAPPSAAGAAKGKGEAISPGAPSDAEIRAELEDLEREQAKVERIILNSSAPIRQGSGRFIWPARGAFTSPFGPRWGRLHAGIDIAAPTGTAIRAADTGQVVLAGPQGGYGNYTCIAHTGALATCYAHQSRILVQVGETVFKADVIGAIGSTGHSTGPHLHFEVRINGRPVDPLAYL